MKLRLLASLLVLVSANAFAFLGPSATQVTVSTNAFTQLAPTSGNVQSILTWLDGNIYTTSSGLLTSQEVQNTFMSLGSNNTTSSGKTNSLSHVTVRGTLLLESEARLPTTAASCTNGEVYTPSTAAAVIVPSGMPSSSTVTNTLGAPPSLGYFHIIAVSSAATNNFAVTNGGTLVGPSINLSAGEMCLLYAVATNKWSALGQ